MTDWSTHDGALLTNWLVDQVILLTKRVADIEGELNVVGVREGLYLRSAFGFDRLVQAIARAFAHFVPCPNPRVTAHRSGFPPDDPAILLDCLCPKHFLCNTADCKRARRT